MTNKISDMMDHILDDTVDIQILDIASSEKIKEATMKKIYPKKNRRLKAGKLSGTAACAAVMIAVLSISTIALGLSVFVSRQAELRASLGVEGKNIPEYVEYSEAGEPAAGGLTAAAVSSMHDAQFQWYYILVQPVSYADAKALTWMVYLPDADVGTEAAYVGGFEQAYDEETHSLLLKVCFPYEALAWGSGAPVAAELSGGRLSESEGEGLNDYSPSLSAQLALTPSEREANVTAITFDNGLAFTNDNGAGGIIYGAEISASGVTWFYTFEDADGIFTALANYESLTPEELTYYREAQAAWINAFEQAIADAQITLADGSIFGELTPNRAVFECGIYAATATWGSPLEVSEIESISVCGRTYRP